MNAHNLTIRQLRAGYGWYWIMQGFALFRKSPLLWIVLIAIYLLIGMALSLFKVIGPIVLNLLAPVFVAGFMLGCRALDNDQELEINHLFAGFRQQTAQLITVGGIYLAGIILVVGIMFAGSDSTMLQAMFAGDKIDQQQAAAALKQGNMGGVLLGLLLLLPLIMAYWFAPLLVVFHEQPALAAMRLSFAACLRNLMPFFVYSVIAMGLLLLAMVPFGLGLLIMIPTMTASLYASYKDVFASAPPAVELSE